MSDSTEPISTEPISEDSVALSADCLLLEGAALLLYKTSKRSYAWEGEDLLAAKILKDRFGVTSGTYVDVGAFDPASLSNTFFFYRRGWRGINIDATPGSMRSFREWRPGDINLEMGIAAQECVMPFIQFDNPELNGFLAEEDIIAQQARGNKVIGRKSVQCWPLASVLDRYNVPRDFDILSVDVEGFDLEVLLSTDFLRYRPKLVITEILGCNDVKAVLENPIALAMQAHSYKVFSKLDFSVMFVDESHTGISA